LRRAFLPPDADSVLHHPRSQESSDERQYPLVFDSPGYPRRQNVVLDPVEELLQVQIHYDVPSFGDILTSLPQRIVRPASGAKTITAFREGRFVHGFEHL